MKQKLKARVAAEFLGTAFLVAAVVGSGIMGERLAGGNTAIALLANTIATGAALYALIVTWGPISGAHLNPVVTAVERLQGGMTTREAAGYIVAQTAGGIAGTMGAHAMFSVPLLELSRHARGGPAQAWSEFVATFGLLAVILGCARFRPESVAAGVASYITAAYWFTASTSFANPAVTIARCFSDTFAGIRPADAPLFLAAQVCGGAAALLFFQWILRPDRANDSLDHDAKHTA